LARVSMWKIHSTKEMILLKLSFSCLLQVWFQ